MFTPGAEQDGPDSMPSGDGAAQGDGLHHHEIHQDEGGGYHSVHTAPDGTEDHVDHVTYDEAKDKMDSDFGEGGEAGDGSDTDGGAPPDSGSNAAADSYRKSCM